MQKYHWCSIGSRLPLTTVLALGGLLSACDGGSSIADAPDADMSIVDAGVADATPPREVITETITLEPGEIVEAVLAGDADDSAQIHLEAPVMELDWNIHGHADGATQTIYEELNQTQVDYTFTPPAEADWYLLLRNSGPDDMQVEVEVELYGEMTWEWL
ncbi:MAG: hypothetical protein GY811_27420 [Myxococcales bacterium]|nr:hypothetical protein [Myxococcales bacterium]